MTKESLELRKSKSLGAQRLFKRIRPEDLNSSLPKVNNFIQTESNE